ncbi:hypothetical protein DNU06_14920 [Putridiphycobacter roseus]|uniref:Uncharacterized protein n=1 Tax=Putridiphycobacter roseus TaxID=2219161 RepID=A0A2W1MW69_9FLAO|nr:hypothetical protein [Putridiphycobacter roseus]PZE16087.1 hypothetical protein DNU06_14920 [Putridiphycobacter roseus]
MKTNFKVGGYVFGLCLISILVMAGDLFSDFSKTSLTVFQMEIEEEEDVVVNDCFIVKETKGNDGTKNRYSLAIIFDQLLPYFSPLLISENGIAKVRIRKLPFYILNCSLVVYS